MSSTRQARKVYRIDQEKLEQYRLQYKSRYNNEHLVSDENQRSYMEDQKKKSGIPIAKILSGKVIDRKTRSTQTSLNEQIHFANKLPIVPRITSVDHIEDTTESLNTLSSSIESRRNNNSTISTSSSLIITKKTTTTKNSSPWSSEFDLHDDSHSDISMQTDVNQKQAYTFKQRSTKPQSTNCRVYIRSIYHHMLSDDTSDEV